MSFDLRTWVVMPFDLRTWVGVPKKQAVQRANRGDTVSRLAVASAGSRLAVASARLFV